MIKLLILVSCSLAFLSCGVPSISERKPVPPQGSEGDLPWNRPQAGEGQGAFGGLLNRQ